MYVDNAVLLLSTLPYYTLHQVAVCIFIIQCFGGVVYMVVAAAVFFAVAHRHSQGGAVGAPAPPGW